MGYSLSLIRHVVVCSAAPQVWTSKAKTGRDLSCAACSLNNIYLLVFAAGL